MKCPICGTRTLPGAKLCTPCRAALKRAKDDSVWEMPAAHASRAASVPPPPAGEEKPPSRWVIGSRLSGWRGLAVGGAALCVTAGVVAAVRLVQVQPHADSADAVAAQSIGNVVAVASPVVANPAVLAPAAAVEPPAAMAVSALRSGTLSRFVDDDPAPPVNPGPRSVPRAPRPRVAAEPTPPPAAPLADPPAPEPPQAPVIERVPPISVDPWQRMGEALSRCAGEGLLARLGCEHRVRAGYCDGNWGRVAQCPGGVVNDHGQ